MDFECEFDPKYTPDSVCGDENTEFILESSSTFDRKVHIGELIQFLTYVSTTRNRKPNYFFVLFLCGEVCNRLLKNRNDKQRIWNSLSSV